MSSQGKFILVARADDRNNLTPSVPSALPGQRSRSSSFNEPKKPSEEEIQLQKEAKNIVQLKREVGIEREPMSRSSADIVAYCCEHQNQDPIWVPALQDERYKNEPCRCTIS